MSLDRRRGPDRRVRHAMPLPPRDGSPVDPATVEGPAVAFGPQAELCRVTMCCVCFAIAHQNRYPQHAGNRPPIDWTRLPGIIGGTRSQAHHEPAQGLMGQPDDVCIPMCPKCHGRKGEPAKSFAVRHSTRYDHDPAGFYRAVGIDDHTRVRDEMRARVAGKAKPSPVVVEDVPVELARPMVAK